MDELIGKKIENYNFVSVLGKGGMGVVYEAIDEKLNRKVAIKVLNSSHISNKTHVIERFRNEAQNHAQLLHQNIVTVYGFLEFSNQFAIVMEYVEGESLEKVIARNTRLHIYDVVYIVRQLLEGIGYAHSKGYIHRDIKPSNIIVNSDGIVKIMDFGISKSLYEESPLTQTGRRVGTVYYMSPEQIKGDHVTTLTDIYSIGCTIYEMITGLPPFYSQNEFDVMDGHLHKQLQPIDEFTPNLSAELNRILNRLLSKDTDERYQSCNEVIIAFHFLDQYLKDSKSESDYFAHKSNRKILSRKKSIIGFSFVILILISLIFFVFIQVKDFMKQKGYSVFEDGNISSMTLPNIDSSFSFSSRINIDTRLSFNSGYFGSNVNGLIIGDSGLVLSFDKEENSWRKRKPINSSNLNNLSVIKNGNIFIVGENSSLIAGNFKNGFKSHSIVNDDYSFYNIDFFNQSTGIIIGSSGILLRSLDGGKEWKRIYTNNSNTLFDLKILNNSRGLAVGMEGTILETNDLGKTWENVEVETDKYLKSISFYNNEIGLIVGGGGTVLRTDDGGSNWQKLESISDNALNKAIFINKDIALIVGNLGTVLTSRDLGETWKIVEPKYFNNWNDILVKSNNRIYLIGDNGTLVELIEGEN